MKPVRDSSKENGLFCIECDYKPPNFALLQFHIMTWHTGKLELTCKECGYSATCATHLTAHMRKHTGEKPFVCDSCGVSYCKKESLKNHMSKHEGTITWAIPKILAPRPKLYCEECSYEAESRIELKDHSMVWHEEPTELACLLCDFKGMSSFQLRNHIVSAHDENNPFVCIFCDFQCNQAYVLRHHMQDHIGNKKYECATCFKKFGSNKQLKEHIKLHKSRNMKYQCKFNCLYCSFRTNSKPALNKHCANAHNKIVRKKFVCDLCKFECTRSLDLMHHVQSHAQLITF